MTHKTENFVPWPLKPETREIPINPATGIRFPKDWGGSCWRGFVSDSRFAGASGTPVIARSNRSVTRKWYRTERREA